MFIKLHTDMEKDVYNIWLEEYQYKFDKFPTYRERTEAFFALRENRLPWWMT